jgi:membrane-bound lytic murein transglycosylase MltF
MRSRRAFRLIASASLATLLGTWAPPGEAQTPKKTAPKADAKPAVDRETHHLPLPDAEFKGDFEEMRKRRLIRVLVVYNKTNYFIDKGTPRGITTEGFKLFEDHINQKYKTKNLRIHVVLIPVRRDALGDLLLAGKGDIAAANITVTPERLEKVDFSAPVLKNVSEIVVSGPASQPVASAEELSGREVFVRKGSIFHESVEKLNDELKKGGKPPVKIRLAPDNLEDEDLLEMLNAGLVQYAVVDDFLASFWAKVLPKITLNTGAVLRKDADIAWAMRKNSPQLKAELDAFIAKYPEGNATRNMLFAKYLKNTKFVKNAASREEMAKYENVVKFFQSYGDKYDMDYLLMAAQGYQESRLDQKAKSPVGAIGVMQVMPATGADMKVGDITQTETNINAGVKYMRFMIDQFFEKEPMDKLNKGLFAFAAYNAGPGRVQKLRKEAEQKGYDPNKWFNNVEIIASQRIGRETVTYVSNIYKYYIAYKLATEDMAERRKAKEEVQKAQ